MDKMVGFITMSIEDDFDENGLTSAQAKYRAYFINTTRYAWFKTDVDTNLQTDGYGDCIVTI